MLVSFSHNLDISFPATAVALNVVSSAGLRALLFELSRGIGFILRLILLLMLSICSLSF